ncbi:hypothetical protein NQZ79_g4064 [Umbelopsis isabellina]|nr:hypothetical protein NQZ79_g4064 [Umbelopsis isabellina]
MDTQKIQTDSKEDIHFLINQLQDATDAATSQHFSNNSLDDETQSQVRDLMNQWVKDVFGMASNGIEINGQSYQEAIQNQEAAQIVSDLEVEPVNEALKLQAESAERKAKELEERVIRKRKWIPAQITPLMEDAIRRQSTLADRISFEDSQEITDHPGKYIWASLSSDFRLAKTL